MGEKVKLTERTLIAGLLLAVVPLLAGYGCRAKQDSQETRPKAKVQSFAKTAPVQKRTAPPKVTTSGTTIKISGSESGDAKLAVQEGGYLIKYRYKGGGLKMETNSALGVLNIVPGGQSAGGEGWTEFEDLTSFTGSGEQQYRITAKEPFEIQFEKLPLPSPPDVPPERYSGSGLRVIGPLKLKAGTTSFRVNCPDLKQAGFIAELFDARTAQNKGIISLGTGTRVVEAKKVQVPSAGDYLLRINANGRSEWTIEVAQ